MGNEIARPQPNIAMTDMGNGRFMLLPRNQDELFDLAAQFSSAGDMVPKCYRGNQAATALAIAWGMELGLSPIQAIQGIAPIGGRANVWGDLQLALCKNAPTYKGLTDERLVDTDAAGKQVFMGYRVTAHREGQPDVTREFTIPMAATAGLLTKDGPWKQYPDRMCYNRARSWALRDQFADALRGMGSAEEATDATPETVTVRQGADPIGMPRAAAPIELQAPDPLDEIDADFNDPDARVGESFLSELAAYPQETQRREYAETVREATPDLAAIAGAKPEAAKPAPVKMPRIGLTPGQAKQLQVAIEMAAPMTMQDLIDTLGDDVHQGNFNQAINVCMGR